jgi:aminoglycoside 3-N-acetyltransferase I
MPDGAFSIQQLTAADEVLIKSLLAMFGEAFDDRPTYTANQPGAAYQRQLFGSANFIALAALKENEVIGGLAAYELRKFEQERSEVYLYDLAVAAKHRRQGIATALIQRLTTLAAARGAYVIFVQADLGGGPAIDLYSKLGVREDVLHFDIPVSRNSSAD